MPNNNQSEPTAETAETLHAAKQSIVRNTGVLFGAQLVTWASTFVLMMFLPRYLGPEEYGRLYFAISINSIIGLMLDLGLGPLIVKEIARNRNVVSEMFFNSAVLRVLAWAVSLVITMLAVIGLEYPDFTVKIVFILCVGNLFVTFSDLIHRVFNGIERLGYRSIAIIAEKVVVSAVGVTLLLLGYGAIEIALAMVLSYLINSAVSIIILRRIVALKPEITTRSWSPMLKGGLPFLITSTVSFVYYRVDVLMLSKMTSDTVVGWYGAPYKLFDTLMFFPGILNAAVYPVLARFWQSSRDSLFLTARRILDLTIIAAVPVAALMIAGAEPIISFLFGMEKFSRSVIILQGLSASLVLVYVDFVFSTVLISLDKQHKLSLIAIGATVINITLNYFLIAYFQQVYGNGALGAVITTMMTEAFVMSMSIFLIPKGLFVRNNLSVAAKAALGGFAMGACIWFMMIHEVNWIMSFSIGMLVYAAVITVTKILPYSEVLTMWNLIVKRKALVT